MPSFARLWLLPRLPELEGSDLHIELALDHRPTDLGAREADIAIRYGRGAWEGLDARLLFSETTFPVVSPILGARLEENCAMERLIEHPLLHDSDISLWRAMLMTCGLKYRPRWQDRRFEDYDTVLAAAEAGLGLALMRAPLAADRLAEGRLVRIHQAEMINPAQHFVCVDRDETRQAVLMLRDRLQASAAV